jgi:hypothetical protein
LGRSILSSIPVSTDGNHRNVGALFCKSSRVAHRQVLPIVMCCPSVSVAHRECCPS